MSVSCIASSSNLFQPTSLQSNSQPAQTTFQELAQALEAGDLTQAQQDYSTLAQNAPSIAQTSSNSPVSQAFSALGQDLKSGNLTAAQKDMATLQQDLQHKATQAYHHHHGSASQMLSSILGAAGLAAGATTGLPSAATSIDLTA